MIKRIFFGSILSVLLWVHGIPAARIHPESYYQQWWCELHGGETEYVFPNGTRCDCLLPYAAIEIDFADKWYEAVGQSLYYGLNALRIPGIVLILEDWNGDRIYLQRLWSEILAYRLPILVWEILVDETGEPYESDFGGIPWWWMNQ